MSGRIGHAGLLMGGAAASPYPGTFDVLMHMDGANGGTTFVEANGKTVTRVGSDVVTSTAQQKFGSASSVGYSGSSHLTVPHSTLVGDFTLGCWARTPTGLVGVSETLLSLQSANLQFGKRDATDSFILWMSGTRVNVLSAVISSVWNLFCLDRFGGVIYASLNGNILGTYAYASTITAGDLTIGAFYDGSENVQSTAYIDEVFLRMNGSMFGGANFTPPAAAFPNS